MRRTVLALSLAAAVLAGSGVALADPTSTPAPGDIVAVGSDTTQVLSGPNGFQKDYNGQVPAPTNKFWSFDATGTGPITTKNNDPVCTLTRPNGTNAGIRQLQNGLHLSSPNQADSCVDLARASRNINAGDGTGIVSAFFAHDIVTISEEPTGNGNGVTFTTNSNIMRVIYACNARLLNPAFPVAPVTWAEIGGTGPNRSDAIVPVLPQRGSAVRTLFMNNFGIADTTLGSCVKDGTFNNNPIEENEGLNAVFSSTSNPNARDVIFPYSAGDYLCQQVHAANTCTDIRGNLMLEPIDGQNALTGTPPTLNIGGFTANWITGLYFVSLNAGTAAAPKVPANVAPFITWLCGTVAQADVVKFGFAKAGRLCGALTGQ